MKQELQVYRIIFGIIVILGIVMIGIIIGSKIHQSVIKSNKSSKKRNTKKLYIKEECITEELLISKSETEDLSETTELHHNEYLEYKFKIEKDIVIIHSDTVI